MSARVSNQNKLEFYRDGKRDTNTVITKTRILKAQDVVQIIDEYIPVLQEQSMDLLNDTKPFIQSFVDDENSSTVGEELINPEDNLALLRSAVEEYALLETQVAAEEQPKPAPQKKTTETTDKNVTKKRKTEEKQEPNKKAKKANVEEQKPKKGKAKKILIEDDDE
jgi:hypothetical protein